MHVVLKRSGVYSTQSLVIVILLSDDLTKSIELMRSALHHQGPRNNRTITEAVMSSKYSQ